MPDSLSDRYAELLTGSYDCVDRIVLNAFFRMGHGPGGFRGVVAGPDRIRGDLGQHTLDANGGPLQPSHSRIYHSPSEVCTPITSRCGVGSSGMPPEMERRLRSRLRPTNDSWRVDETYIRVKGKWVYLYRAVDFSGATIDFLLSAKRDAAAAERFLAKALGGENHPAPRVINTNEHAGYPSAIMRLKAEEALKENCRHRPVQYLNNVLEQDHRAIKRRIRASQHFRSFWGAWRTIAGYEAIHMIRKG